MTKSTRAKPHKHREQDEIFYAYLWEHLPHYCENCLAEGKTKAQAWLGREHQYFFWSHLLTKNANPKIRYLVINISPSCWDCHQQWDKGEREGMAIFSEDRLSALRLIDTQLSEACWLTPETLLSNIA